MNKKISATGKYAFAALLLTLTALLACARSVPETGPWSVRMAESVMLRHPDPWMIDYRGGLKWEYTQGLVLKAMLEVWQTTGQRRYLDYVDAFYNIFVSDSIDVSDWDRENILTYDPHVYNIDRINPGKPLFKLYELTGREKYEKALHLLRDQMRSHPRVSEGGFWHKKRYPHQMWLDGLYMGSPFLAQYAAVFHEEDLFADVIHQFVLMEKHAREATTGLLYHGWDESRQQRWADAETGCSSQFWGRAMGWYAMGLVDALDYIPEDYPGRDDLVAILSRLAKAVTAVQDRETGVWYQVLDQAGKKGNYLESTASSMFVYALLKGVRKGYLHEAYLHIARQGYEGILEQFITVGRNGEVSIEKCCAVAGLGGDPYRDGSFEYYVGEEIRSNDPKAVGPFIMASLEMEALKK